jgi:uncharacterized phage protein (TIGR02218 family)
MRRLPEGLQAHLDSGATTLCWCWKLEGLGGPVLGFTDHDESLQFDGLVFEASSGFSGSEIQSSLGLNVDNLEASGALSSERLREEDLRAGRFDNALVEIWLVNWMNPAQRLLLRKGNIGEITRGDSSFTAEVRGLSHHLNQPQGRIYQYGCDASLGDQRCRADLTPGRWAGWSPSNPWPASPCARVRPVSPPFCRALQDLPRAFRRASAN